MLRRQDEKEDATGLEVQRVEIDALKAPANDDDDPFEALHLAVGYGHPVPDARGAEVLSIKENPECDFGVEPRDFGRKRRHQLGQHLGLGLGYQIPDHELGLEILLETHLSSRIRIDEAEVAVAQTVDDIGPVGFGIEKHQELLAARGELLGRLFHGHAAGPGCPCPRPG